MLNHFFTITSTYRSLALLPAFLLVSFSQAALPLYQPGSGITGESVDQIAEWALEKYDVPGVAVAIVKDGEVFHSQGYGVRNIDTGKPVTAQTIFQLASVSKTFTAVAFAASVDNGKLGWEDPVASAVLPGFEMSVPYATEWVTGTDYMTHRSGFPGFFGDLFDHLGYSRPDIRHRVRFVEPGYSFRNHAEYSNLGFFLAGEMVAEAEGLSFEEAVQQSILDPLGMKDTGKAAILLVGDQARENVAASHAEIDGKTVVVPHNLSKVFVSAGGLSSSAEDLASYMKMLVNGGQFDGESVLSKEATDQMFEPVIASEVGFSEFPPIDESSGFDYSPGWGVFHYNGLKVLEKGGALDGVRTIVVLVPEKNFGIAILANMNLTAAPEAIRAGILQQMFGLPGEADLQPEIFDQATQIHDMLFGSMQEPEADESLTPDQINAFVGTYVSDLYGVWSVVRDENEPSKLVLVCGPAKYKGKLTATDANTLAVEWPIVISGPIEMPFEFETGGSATSFSYRDYPFRRLGKAE